MSSARLARIDQVVRSAIQDGASPGASVVIGRRQGVVWMKGYGHVDWDINSSRVSEHTIYDIASLTKAIGTTLAVMKLVEEDKIGLHAPISRYLPEWPTRGPKGRIEVQDLLLHTAGLTPGLDLWRKGGCEPKIRCFERIAETPLIAAPGRHVTYSDLSMILLARIVERVSKQGLDEYLEKHFYGPLGLKDTRFAPLRGLENPESLKTRIAPTEYDRAGGKHVHGIAHDRNARELGGVAGHAGLFSSARDLAVLAHMLLNEGEYKGRQYLKKETVKKFTTRVPGVDRTLGWDVPHGDKSSAGIYFSRSAFGHTGFTGTSIWIDPERDLFVILLTNRVNPSASNQKHRQLRIDLHNAAQLAIANKEATIREDAKPSSR